MVPLPPQEPETRTADSVSASLAGALADLRGYEPPTWDSSARDYRLLLVFRLLQEVQMALDVVQANHELRLDQLGQKMTYLQKILEDMAHRDFLDR